MADPDVSVVVPTRNRAALLSRLLTQLAKIDDELAYEVIVIDEGSTDTTPVLLALFADAHGFRTIRHEVPRGLSAARNAGLDAARGAYVAWIDDDDLTSPDRLRRQFEALTASDIGWSCAGRVDIDDMLTVVGHRRCPPTAGFAEAILLSNTLPSAAQGLLVDRELARAVGGFDESLTSAEDWDFCIRLAAAAEPHFLDEPLVAYRTGVPSMSTDSARMEQAIRSVVTKHADRYAALGVQPDWHAIHHSLLTADLAASRWLAARRAGRAFLATPSAKAAGRAALVLVAPHWFAARSHRHRRQQVPAAWETAARAWLEEINVGDPG